MNIISKKLLLLALCAASSMALADGNDEPIPSYYEEAGISRTRDYTDQHPNERIDPFTGKLQWHFVDLFLPGNGGMDIKVQRSYSSLNDLLYVPSSAGLGWTMHFGRIRRTASVPMCDAQNLNATKNPVLELPDGSSRILYPTADQLAFVTTDFWKAKCNLSGTGGLNVHSPDGTLYEMTLQGVSMGVALTTQNNYYPTRITDRNGNWMSLSYMLLGTGGAAVTAISTNDGRTVTFAYNGSAIKSVTDGVRTWTYVQAAATGDATKLTEVIRPDGTSWKFEYYAGATPGGYSMKKVTYPAGGTIAYTYGFVNFAQNIWIPRSTVVLQKVSKPSAAKPDETWAWAYTPATQALPVDQTGSFHPYPIPPAIPAQMDRTVVAGPDGSKTYYHAGYHSVSPGSVYAIGSLLGTASTLEAEAYSYAMIHISNQVNKRPGETLVSDWATYAPLVTRHGIGRSAESFSTNYGDFDVYGNPQSIIETGSDTRTTAISYATNPSKWILRVKGNEVVTQGGETLATTRTFDGNLNMLSETRAGVATNFSYTAQGDLASRTDARNKTTSYSAYHRGIPQAENQPGGVTISRVVSDAGNVTAQTDGEGATTSFSYDGLNRVTGIAHPLGNPVAVVWSPTTRKVTRGGFEELTTYDGFGREASLRHTGGLTVITQNYEVDSLGRRVFASYPNSALGTGFTFDMLNRPRRVLNESNAARTIWENYRSLSHFEYKTQLINERGFAHVYRYRSFGDPNKRDVVAIADPVTNTETTAITRNIAGQMTSATLDGVTRSFGYDSRLFLTSVSEPESGLTSLGRDAVGNMTTRQVGAAGQTAYTYDDRNRVTAITYPAGTPSVVKTYFKDDKPESVNNGVARKDYSYNANKSLISETLTTGGKAFQTQYAYNTNDALSTLTYGSGRSVSYAPDAFGRATRVGSFVTAVAYHPSGQPSSFTYGNGVQTAVDLNTRQWPSNLRITKTSDLFNMGYGYDAVGNVTGILDNVDSTYSRSLGYDQLDRLWDAWSNNWGPGTVDYDLRGNITNKTIGSVSQAYVYDATTHRLATVRRSINGSLPLSYAVNYDAYGNVSERNGVRFGYNDALNMRCAKCGQPDETLFDYDGAGQRVRALKGGVETVFVHGQGGQLLWEETTNAKRKEYIYLGGKQVATQEQQLP